MSKKHLEEQKLLIENFNKWINEEETDDPIKEEKEELQEIFMLSGALYATAKFITGLSNILGTYNELTRITDEMMQDPDTPEAIKAAASAVSDIKDEAGIANDLPLGQKLTQTAVASLLKKHLGITIDPNSIPMPGSLKGKPGSPATEEPAPSPTPGPEPDPEDMESRAKLGLMSKEKEDRITQLRAKRTADLNKEKKRKAALNKEKSNGE